MDSAEMINIGSRRELFVDNYLVDTQSGNTSFRLHSPTSREAILVTNRPWEGNACGFITVFRDGDRFRMYYKAWNVFLHDSKGDDGSGLKSAPLYVCYAESADGIRWERPNLGLFEFEGSTENNIVWAGVGPEMKGIHGFAPFKDTNPACLPEHRYKAVGGERAATKGDLWTLCSPDGIHWSQMQDKPIFKQDVHGSFDSQNLAFWDAIREEYRIYFRAFKYNEIASLRRCRAIKTAVSKDFITWSEPEWLLYPGSPTEQLYTNQVISYPRAPHIFIGFPTRYVERSWSPAIEAMREPEHRRLRADVKERFGAALTDGLFMSSRDGRTFKRWGEAFLRPGPQIEGNWAYGDNYQCWGLIETSGYPDRRPTEYSFFATEGFWRGQSTTFRRYSIRKDGFVSMHASLAGGEVISKPLIFSGKELQINFATSAAGSIHFEIQGADCRPIPGFTLEESIEMIGDELDRNVTWKSGRDVSRFAGQPVRLRFVMKDADLYAVQFREK